MPGILPTILSLGLSSVGDSLVPGRLLFLTAGGTVAALGVARYRANRSAAAALRASESRALAQRTADLMFATLADLAPLLGLGRGEVARWVVDGVPTRHQPAVADLYLTTVALRRRFPAQVARRLLAVRAERGATVRDARRQLADLSRASRSGHITVTLR